MDEKLLTIGEAAAFLNVSQMTLRRWDKGGKLIAIRKKGGTHRFYHKRDLELLASDLKKLAHDWIQECTEIPEQYYCQNSAVFLARLSSLESVLIKTLCLEQLCPVIVSVAGEIGNNSFDHNIGKWPDKPGIFFGYDIGKGVIVLADRGLGVLRTLQQIKPDIPNHVNALHIAFTEIISGRFPENRGNGLKFVREIVSNNPINLFFTSGDAELRLQAPKKELQITRSSIITRGCYATLAF